MTRRLVVLSFLALAVAGGAASAQEPPFLDYTASGRAPGSPVTFRGTGMPSCATGAEVVFDGATRLGVTPVTNGAFEVPLRLPYTVADPPAGLPHQVAVRCLGTATDITSRTIVAESGSVPVDETAPSIMGFAGEATNAGAPGTRVNAVGVFPDACPAVHVAFEGAKVAESPGHADVPTFSGAIFDVPAGATNGEHVLSASCDVSGQPVRVAAAFTVTGGAAATATAAPTAAVPPVDGELVGGPSGQSHERSRFTAALTRAGDVSWSPGDLLASLLLALVLLLLVFPAELFNSTLDAHYDEVRGWFGLKPREARAPRFEALRESWPAAVAFLAVGALLYGFLDPDFGADAASVALFLGLLAGLLVVTAVFTVGQRLYMRSRHGDAGTLRMLPGTLLVAAICVLLSRVADFQPGYLYGLLVGFAFATAVDDEDEGRTSALTVVTMLAVSLVAWLAWGALDAGSKADPALPLLVADAALAAVFVAGVESAVFGLVPLRYLRGAAVLRWSKPAWVTLFALSAFLFVQLVVRPAGDVEGRTIVTMLVLFGSFGAVSLAFWGWFRMREPAAT